MKRTVLVACLFICACCAGLWFPCLAVAASPAAKPTPGAQATQVVQYADLVGGGQEQKIVLNLIDVDGQKTGEFLRIFDGKKTLFESPVGCNVVDFSVVKLRPGKRSQVLIGGLCNTTDGGPEAIIEFIDGKFLKTFDVAYLYGFDLKDLDGDSVKEIVVWHRYCIKHVYRFEPAKRKFVRANKRYREFYRKIIRENQARLIWNGEDRLKRELGDGQDVELGILIAAYKILGDDKKSQRLRKVYKTTFGEDFEDPEERGLP